MADVGDHRGKGKGYGCCICYFISFALCNISWICCFLFFDLINSYTHTH